MLLDEIVDHARRIAREIAGPHAALVDREARWPAEALGALRTAGLFGLVVPRECGGHGHGLLAVARVCEALGEHCASTAICFGMHCVASAVIAAKATDEQRERWLVPIAEGRHLTTLALSEGGTGAHFYLPETRLDRAPGGAFVVDGTKTFVTNGGHADSYVVSTAAAELGAPPGQFSWLLVPADAPGLEWGAGWDGWGMRGNSARTLELRHVGLPAVHLLGREGDETWFVFHVVAPFFLMAMAGTYLGVASAAFSLGRQHLLDRRYSHSGGSLAREPVLQHRLGTLWAQVERTRALVCEAGRRGDAGAEDALSTICSAKAEVAECADRVTADVMTLLGGQGYRSGSLVHRLYRDARAAHVMSPTTDMLRTWTGRALLGLPLLGG